MSTFFILFTEKLTCERLKKIIMNLDGVYSIYLYKCLGSDFSTSFYQSTEIEWTELQL